MSIIALGTDGKSHMAGDFNDTYTGEYFCPGEGCQAKLILKIRANPYFSALPTAPHTEGCEYSQRSLSYNEIKDSGFTCDDFFAGILKPTGNGTVGVRFHDKPEHPGTPAQNSLTTINKLYRYCLQHNDDSRLPDGKKIFEIYQEKRNAEIKNWKRNKYRLIKLGFKNCNYDYNERTQSYNIWCWFPHTENTVPPAVYYVLEFEEEIFLRYFCKILNPMKKKYGNAYIVAGGEWKGTHCRIKSKRQIYICHKEISGK